MGLSFVLFSMVRVDVVSLLMSLVSLLLPVVVAYGARVVAEHVGGCVMFGATVDAGAADAATT